jgi:hypothetical protein
MDHQPGENHFAEALAKSLGPTAKDPTARTQIVSLVSRLEPEAASTGFSSSNSTGPAALLLLQMTSQNSMQMQQSAVGGLGTQSPSSAFGTLPQFGNIPSVYDGNRWWRSKRPRPYLQLQGPGDSSKEWHFEY